PARARRSRTLPPRRAHGLDDAVQRSPQPLVAVRDGETHPRERDRDRLRPARLAEPAHTSADRARPDPARVPPEAPRRPPRARARLPPPLRPRPGGHRLLPRAARPRPA